MPGEPIISEVHCSFSRIGGLDSIEVTVIDTVKQQCFRFVLPPHTLPALALGLAGLIQARPGDFPGVLLHSNN